MLKKLFIILPVFLLLSQINNILLAQEQGKTDRVNLGYGCYYSKSSQIKVADGSTQVSFVCNNEQGRIVQKIRIKCKPPKFARGASQIYSKGSSTPNFEMDWAKNGYLWSDPPEGALKNLTNRVCSPAK